MKISLSLSIAILLGAIRTIAQIAPELPNTTSIETCFPDTTGYSIISVGPVGRDYSDLQLAINAATPGTIMLLDAGATFQGSFSLPNKTGDGWIILCSAQMNLLPMPETRIQPDAATGNSAFPTQKDAMAKIITTHPAGLPCFRTNASAHHYRFVGLEISVDEAVLNSYGLMFLGDASTAQSTLNVVPHHLIVDRCYIHGHTNATVMKGGVILNCANAAVIDSYLSDFHSIGFDTYAIAGTNGPGPFKILNNYLEAAGENILFGGAAPSIPNLVPSDIEVRNNHFFKPFSWRVGHPDYAGKHWTIKNLFELKTGVRVLLDGNVLENSWADLPIGQSGYAILLTVRAEGGAAPQAAVQDITITNNIIRHAGAGISLSGHDDQANSSQSQRIRIANNLFYDIAGPNDGTFIKIGDPRDVTIDHNTVFQSGAITWAYDTIQSIAITNNIFHCFISDGGYQGIYGPGFAQGGNGPLGAFFPGITDVNQRFHQNVLIGGNAAKYNNYNTLSQNYFPATAANVSFVDYANGGNNYHDFALANASVYKNAASDGGDIGVDFAQMDTALINKALCQPSVSTNNLSLEINWQIQPNPAHDHVWIISNTALEQAELVAYNILGQRRIQVSDISGRNVKIAIGDWEAGLYFVTLLQANGMPVMVPLMVE